MDQKRQATVRIAVASLVLTAGLLVVGWYDYTSTRNELLTLLVDQAASMRQAVAAAASLGEAAATQTQAALAARLLDNARLLRLLDARGGLTAGATRRGRAREPAVPRHGALANR